MSKEALLEHQEDEQFSATEALHSFRLSMVPFLAERVIDNKDCSEIDCSPEKLKEITNEIIDIANKTQTLKNHDMDFIDYNNTTVALIYDPDEHRMTITSATTKDFADFKDAVFNSGGTEHSWGGEVHSGYYRDLAQEFASETPGKTYTVVDMMEGVILSKAALNDEKPLTIDATGFCSGAAKTGIALSKMFENGFFENSPNVKLGNVHFFATAGYVDPSLKQKIENGIEEAGGKVWDIKHPGDPVAKLMTPDGGLMSYKMGYDSLGTPVLIVPKEGSLEAQTIVNPTDEDKEMISDAVDSSVLNHWITPYERTLVQLADIEQNGQLSPENNVPTEDVQSPNRLFTDQMLTGL